MAVLYFPPKGGNKMNVYGYIRVSSRDQNEDRQRIALHEQGVEDGFIYTDKVSGAVWKSVLFQTVKNTKIFLQFR